MKRYPKIPRGKNLHAQLPHVVMLSPAFLTLPYFGKCVLLTLAAQFTGGNNGDLALTWLMARAWGIRSKNHHARALAMLLERGLIQRTRQGGKRPLGPTLYALTWRPIHDRTGGYDSGIGPTIVAANSFLNWIPNGTDGSPANGTAGGAQTAHQRDRPRGVTGPPAGRKTRLTGPPAGKKGQKTPFNGTAGGPPSISTRSVYPQEHDAETDQADDVLGQPPW